MSKFAERLYRCCLLLLAVGIASATDVMVYGGTRIFTVIWFSVGMLAVLLGGEDE